VIGATVLSNVYGKAIAPFVNVYLAAMGVLILLRAFRRWMPPEPGTRGMPLIGFGGGLLDAMGGGGWGPIVTGTLIGNGHTPRYAIGSVNLTEFLVTLATSATFIVTLGIADLTPVIPLILGGLVSAPFAGYLTRVVPARPLMVVVACLILVLSGRALLKVAGLI
jgi:uncharacterized membrane protein YfcA